MANVKKTSSPQLKSKSIEQTMSGPSGLVQGSRQSTVSDPTAPATRSEVPQILDPTNGPSVLQGRDEVNPSGMPHYSRPLDESDLSRPHPVTDDFTVQQLRQTVAIQQAQLDVYQQTLPTVESLQLKLEAQNDKLLRSQKHLLDLVSILKKFIDAIVSSVPATSVPQPSTSDHHSLDLTEPRSSGGHFTGIGTAQSTTSKPQEVIGTAQSATSKPQEVRGSLAAASVSRVGATTDKTRFDKFENLGTSSLHTTQQSSHNPSESASHPVSAQIPDNDPGDETEEDDWKSKGAAALLRAAMPSQSHTVAEHPYAPTAPRANTQGSKPRDPRALVGSSRESGGRSGQKKRGRDEDGASGRASKAKKTNRSA